MRKILIFLLCFCTIFLCFVIPSFADEGLTPRAVPTDLTGYTVTVPAGWSASAGYGSFGLFADLTVDGATYNIIDFNIGYDIDFRDGMLTPSPGYISCYDDGIAFTYSSAFTLFNISGGNVTDSLLIQWLVDNNATFSGGSDPEPVTYSIPSGYYKLADLPTEGVPSVGGFVVNIEFLFEVPVEVSYSSGVVKQYNYFGFMLTNFEDSENFSIDFTVKLLDIGDSVRIANLTAVDGVCTSQFYGGITNFYIGEDIVTDEESYQLISFMFVLDPSFIPDEPDIPDIRINPWAYILEMIIEALKVPLFGYFSVWDIFITICGIFILTWLLKLLAGG